MQFRRRGGKRKERKKEIDKRERERESERKRERERERDIKLVYFTAVPPFFAKKGLCFPGR